MSESGHVFERKPGSPWSQEQVDAFGPEFEKLKHLTNPEILEWVKEHTESAIAQHLDAVQAAADEWWLRQIISMRQSYEVVVTLVDDEPVRVRGNYMVPVTLIDEDDERRDRLGHPAKIAVSACEIRQDAILLDYRRQQLVRATVALGREFIDIRDLVVKKDKDLATLFRVIDSLQKRLSRDK